MTAYYNQSEIKKFMKNEIKQYLKDCISGKKLSEDCKNLIKYTFLATFVSYNEADKTIEIGIEDTTSDSSYPDIKVYTYPVDSVTDWLTRSLKFGKNDLAFYGKLLNKKRSSDIVVM